MSGCDCLRRIDDTLTEKGNPTRVSPVLFLDGSAPRAAIESYVPDESQPRAASGRIVRRITPARLVASFCPWCGQPYPGAAPAPVPADPPGGGA